MVRAYLDRADHVGHHGLAFWPPAQESLPELALFARVKLAARPSDELLAGREWNQLPQSQSRL